MGHLIPFRRSRPQPAFQWSKSPAAAVLQLAYYYPKLPDEVALHFDGAGEPDSWGSKGFMLGLNVGVAALQSLIFFAIHFAFAKLPDSLLNLPNKDYWLAPERREQTYASLCSHMLWFGCATLIFLILVFQLAIQANLREDRTLGGAFWPFLVGYLVFAAAWLVRFFRRFKRPPSSMPS